LLWAWAAVAASPSASPMAAAFIIFMARFLVNYGAM